MPILTINICDYQPPKSFADSPRGLNVISCRETRIQLNNERHKESPHFYVERTVPQG